LFARDYYIAEGKLLVSGKWDTTVLAGQAVRAQYFQDEAEREETGRRKTVLLDADDPREEEAADEPGADDLKVMVKSKVRDTSIWHFYFKKGVLTGARTTPPPPIRSSQTDSSRRRVSHLEAYQLCIVNARTVQ
jgi:hypothetical protein